MANENGMRVSGTEMYTVDELSTLWTLFGGRPEVGVSRDASFSPPDSAVAALREFLLSVQHVTSSEVLVSFFERLPQALVMGFVAHPMAPTWVTVALINDAGPGVAKAALCNPRVPERTYREVVAHRGF